MCAQRTPNPNLCTLVSLTALLDSTLGRAVPMRKWRALASLVIGVLIMGTVENVMNLLNIDAFYQYLVRGAILLAAVLLDQLKNRGSRD